MANGVNFPKFSGISHGDSNVYFTFGLTVYENGIYYFRIKNRATGETYGTTTFEVNFENIIKYHEENAKKDEEESANIWTTIGDFFNKILEFFASLLEKVGQILSYFNPFSENFFLRPAFVMSEEQEAIHKNNQEEFRSAIANKIPFAQTLVDLFNTVIDAHKNVEDAEYNPLNIKFGAFHFDFGAIHAETQETDLTNVLLKYEPYRVQARNLLKLIVYAIGIVYLVKHFLNYGITQGAQLGTSIAKRSD